MKKKPTLFIRENAEGIWICEKCPVNKGLDFRLVSYQASLVHAANHICSGKFSVRHVKFTK